MNTEISSNTSTVAGIQSHLHTCLKSVGNIERCILLNYPNHPNIGDHLIWLGSTSYLTNVMGARIDYAASPIDFCAERMERKAGKAPIFILGGGNLGDLWHYEQDFREFIIEKYHDRPIISLPQSICFRSSENARRASKTFNSHPNLTLFIRDAFSYDLACQYFPNCRIIQAPDMAFQLNGIPDLPFPAKRQQSTLYHCRNDIESALNISELPIKTSHLTVKDWVTFDYVYKFKDLQWYWQIPGSAALVREGWQRRLANPGEWISRQIWQTLYQNYLPLKAVYNSSLQLQSWSFLHAGIYLFQQYPLIITNRLHGHILATLLGIPNLLLSNSYHKNKVFYETWTKDLPLCKFISDPNQIQSAIQDLLDCYSAQSSRP